jgi:hypothetical protein
MGRFSVYIVKNRKTKVKSPILHMAEEMGLYFFVILSHLILLFEVQKTD